MDQNQLQRLVEDISIKYFNQTFEHTATFNSRLKTTGGRYHLRSHNLDFNPKVFQQLGIDGLVGVIKHELCHYHLHLSGKGYRHRDPEFKQLLTSVGGLRYVPKLETTSYRWVYSCSDCGSEFKRIRKMDVKKYVCGRCRGKLHVSEILN